MRKLGRVLAWTLALLIGAALLLRALILDIWTLPEDDARLTAAVAPTLLPGDTVLMLTRGTPGFGDLVRCADPDDSKRFIVARIAGLAGDHVEIEERTLRVSGQNYNGEISCPEADYSVAHPTSGDIVPLQCDVVRMGGGWHYRAYSQRPSALASPTKTDVGQGMLFLLSDDRSFHDDSRDFGTVPRSSCKGLIFFRLWSKGGMRDEKHRFLAIH
jgi:signal peptidase I